MPYSTGGRGLRRRRRGWRRKLQDWWFVYVQPPGSPNLWLVVIPLMLAGAIVVALLSGFLAGEDVTSAAREIVRNPFRPPKRPVP